MKNKFSAILLSLFIAAHLYSDNCSNVEEAPSCNTGSAATESAFMGRGMSMMAWGVGLASAIAILTGVLDQSTPSSHAHN